MRTVAALCVARRTHYKDIPGVECFDIDRDARSFAGGMPVVAHPPCRAWSAFCAHQAKPPAGEKELGPLCVEWLRKECGILEHPAHSRLFDHCHLPKPGWAARGELWTAGVSQSWWGDSRTKSTWLCFFGINPNDVTFPLRLHSPHGDKRRWQVMSRNQRAATCPEMAEWLVDHARMAQAMEVPT